MAYVMFQYDRPTDTQHWNEYNRHVRDWIARLLQLPEQYPSWPIAPLIKTALIRSPCWSSTPWGRRGTPQRSNR